MSASYSIPRFLPQCTSYLPVDQNILFFALYHPSGSLWSASYILHRPIASSFHSYPDTHHAHLNYLYLRLPPLRFAFSDSTYQLNRISLSTYAGIKLLFLVLCIRSPVDRPVTVLFKYEV